MIWSYLLVDIGVARGCGGMHTMNGRTMVCLYSAGGLIGTRKDILNTTFDIGNQGWGVSFSGGHITWGLASSMC